MLYINFMINPKIIKRSNRRSLSLTIDDKGDLIGHVGPKYVYGVSGNTYKDADGRPTNGATTGCHLHIGFRLDGEYVNPMDYLNY